MPNAILLKWNKKLIELRSSLAAIKCKDRQRLKINIISDKVLEMVRNDNTGKHTVRCFFNFGPLSYSYQVYTGKENIEKILSSCDPEWCVVHNKEILPDLCSCGETLNFMPWSISVYRCIVQDD